MQKGDKVICVNDQFNYNDPQIPKEYLTISVPVKGEEYTIREVVRTNYGIGIRLEEIKNKQIYHTVGGWQEPIFSVVKFIKK